MGFAFMEPYYHQQDGPAGQFPSERDAAWGPACGHHRFYAAVLSPRPRAVVARARYLAMLVATTRLRASECRAENRAIAVALMIPGFRRWFAGVQPAQLTKRFKAKLFNRLRETAECMAADGRQKKPCLCPSSRRSLTRSRHPARRADHRLHEIGSLFARERSLPDERVPCHERDRVADGCRRAHARTTSLAASRHQ